MVSVATICLTLVSLNMFWLEVIMVTLNLSRCCTSFLLNTFGNTM